MAGKRRARIGDRVRFATGWEATIIARFRDRWQYVSKEGNDGGDLEF